jgi:AraC family transcriptional regulator
VPLKPAEIAVERTIAIDRTVASNVSTALPLIAGSNGMPRGAPAGHSLGETTHVSPRILSGVLSVERLMFGSDLLCAGSFRCVPGHPLFKGGMPSTSHRIVFPRRAVWIQHEGGRRFVVDQSVVTLYNRNVRYWRWAISPEGDRSDWLAFPGDVIRQTIAAVAPSEGEGVRVESPFHDSSVAATARLYAAQRTLFSMLERGGTVDPLPIEERALSLLEAVIRQAYSSRATGARPKRVRDAIEHVREQVARDPSAPTLLPDLAASIGWSAPHLCREFRRHCGMTITDYRTQLRVRSSLERIGAGEKLVDVAMDLGFSSHSHFTATFRHIFGRSPAEFRSTVRRVTTPKPPA